MGSIEADQACVRRADGIRRLAKLLAVAADFLAREDAAPEALGSEELVAVGRAAIATRLCRDRVRAANRLRTFDQALIQALVRCAIDAMVEAQDPAVRAPARAAHLLRGRALKRSPGLH